MHAKTFNESDIKAAFLYYFLYFITWPDQEVDNKSDPLKFCSFDAGPVTQTLESILASPKAINTAVEIHIIENPAEATECNYVYVDSKNSASTALVISATSGKSILTVSDNDGFANAGGMIELTRISNKVKVRINLEVLSLHRLKASSKLLKLAEIVTRSNVRGGIDVPEE
ncbi:MAG: YfiR family protein [Oceanicoccus sp.]